MHSQYPCPSLGMGFGDKKIAVIGGGLGGLSFMNAAMYAGLNNIHVYEAAAEFGEVGAGVNITRNAARLLEAYGLDRKMRYLSGYSSVDAYMEYRHYRTGEYLGHVDEFGEPNARKIHRADLLDVLKSRLPESMISKGKRLAAIERDVDRDCYRLRFQDGTVAFADIIVGCDGIKSVVRSSLGFKDTPRYSGQMVYRGFVDYDDLPHKYARLFRGTINHRGPRRHVLTLPIGNAVSKTDKIGVIGFMTEPLERWTSESWLAKAPVDDLYAQVRDWCEPVQELVKGLRKNAKDDKILKQTLYVRDPTPKWYCLEEGKTDQGIVLLGDAVHSTLPHQGQRHPLSFCLSDRRRSSS